jgi:ubiquinone/menaquinone biosynthesis C-methylase UbiE
MPESSEYVHGTSEEEQARLTRLNTLLNEGSLRELAARPGERLLDVGAGLGQFARAVAKITGVRAVGVERSRVQMAEGARQAALRAEGALVDLREGDARDLPLTNDEWGQFDIAHARFLLEHVPQPLEVVKGMVRSVRPGGRIVLEDDDHDLLRLYPEPPGLSAVWNAYMRSYDRAGNDPVVGRRLVQLLEQAGAEPRRITWIFFGACSGDPNFELYVENLAVILEQAERPIAQTGLSPENLARALSELRAWKARPDAALWYAMSWAEGVRPTEQKG